MSEDLKQKAMEALKTYQADMEVLQTEREKSIKQYMREPYGDEEEGRSKVVMSDTFDTIETIMPYLMRVFYGGQDVAKFSGAGEGDERGAELLGELVNFFVHKRMNGFVAFHDWFKEALVCRISVAKYWFEKRTDYRERRYEGLTADEYDALIAKDGIEVVKVEETVVEEAVHETFGMDIIEVAPAIITYDVDVKIAKEIRHPMFEPLPSEEFYFDVKAKKITDSPCFHRRRMHKNEILAKYGKKVDEEELTTELESYGNNTDLWQTRFHDLGGINFILDQDDYFYLWEAYLDDYDKDGNKKPMKLVILGDRLLDSEDNTYGEPPFIDLTPIRLPHRAVGLDMATILADIQKIHTALYRAILDNIYFQNNAREIFDPSAIDSNDLYDGNRPGGKIPTKPGKDPRAAVFPMPVTPLSTQTYEMATKTIPEMRQDRTGINRYVQGDDKGLNKTAFGVNTLLNQALQRQELLARVFAETGVSKLFRKLAELTIEFMDVPQAIKLNGRWQTIDPKAIDVDFDVNIDVGIGTGTKDVIVQQMQMMMQLSMPLIPTGIVTPENIYNIMKNIYEAMGYKSVEEFITEAQTLMPGMGGMNVNPMAAGPGAAGFGIGAAPLPSAGFVAEPPGGGVPGGPTLGAY